MTITTKYSIGDIVVFDGTRKGQIVGFEILHTMKEPDYTRPNYPQYKDHTEVRYQIKPVDGGQNLCGSMRHENDIAKAGDPTGSDQENK